MFKRSPLIYVGLLIFIVCSFSLYSLNYRIVPTFLGLFIVLVFILMFESKVIAVEKLVLIALLVGIACSGRVTMAAFPSVQPVTFIVIMSGIVLGAEVGLMVGILSTLTSNFFLGMGPWTVPQMFSWGMIGILSALMSHVLRKFYVVRILWCCICGYLFGLLMNIYFVFSYYNTFSAEIFIISMLTSFLFDTFHAFSNVFFAVLVGNYCIFLFERVQFKYRI